MIVEVCLITILPKKYDLELPEPFGLKFLITDVEDRLPSFECRVAFLLCVSGATFQYSIETWFECSVYDKFLSQLKKIHVGEDIQASFYNMGCEFTYSVSPKQFSVSADEIDRTNGSARIELRSDFDRDLLGQHIRNLEDFPKWW